MIKKVKYTGEEAITFLGVPLEPDTLYEIQPHELVRWQWDSQVEEWIGDGTLVVNTGDVDLEDPVQAISYLRVAQFYPSTWAVDKHTVDEEEVETDHDQEVTTTDSTKIDAKRILWDQMGEVDLENSNWAPSINGIWHLNGTVALKSCSNVARARIEIFRNDELWFVVADQPVGPLTSANLIFSCDVDAYASESHVFDLRLALVKENPLAAVSATISGSDEDTAWGMTFVQPLAGHSPT